MRFQNGSKKVAIELHVVQFWSEIILMISNRTRATRSFDFEITRMISDQIALHSVQLPLYIILRINKWKEDFIWTECQKVLRVIFWVLRIGRQLRKIDFSFISPKHTFGWTYSWENSLKFQRFILRPKFKKVRNLHIMAVVAA